MKVQAQAIVLEWLRRQHTVPMHRVELELPTFGKLHFNLYFNPGTYARVFRRLKSNSELLRSHGLQVVEDHSNPNKTEKTWKVLPA